MSLIYTNFDGLAEGNDPRDVPRPLMEASFPSKNITGLLGRNAWIAAVSRSQRYAGVRLWVPTVAFPHGHQSFYEP